MVLEIGGRLELVLIAVVVAVLVERWWHFRARAR
jgi:hypothetical protein